MATPSFFFWGFAAAAGGAAASASAIPRLASEAYQRALGAAARGSRDSRFDGVQHDLCLPDSLTILSPRKGTGHNLTGEARAGVRSIMR